MYIFEKDSSAQIKSEKREKWVIVGKTFLKGFEVRDFFFYKNKEEREEIISYRSNFLFIIESKFL